MAAQRVLDLAQLDAVPADLDLAVLAAEELERPVRTAAGTVARAVEPRLERRAHEALRGQRGVAGVAARQPGAGEMQLARDADRDRLAGAVEHVGARVGDRAADRQVAVDRPALHEARDRGLREPVGVVRGPAAHPPRGASRRRPRGRPPPCR